MRPVLLVVEGDCGEYFSENTICRDGSKVQLKRLI